jgi:hypothetical protein
MVRHNLNVDNHLVINVQCLLFPCRWVAFEAYVEYSNSKDALSSGTSVNGTAPELQQ